MATHSRVAKMAAINPAWASRSGKRGAWLVTDAGLNILLRMRELEQDGASVDAALEIIQQEMSKPAAEEEKAERLNRLHDETQEMLLERIEEYKRQIAELKQEKERLWHLLESLTPALRPPAQEEKKPPKRSFWPWRK